MAFPHLIRAARALVNLTQAKLARLSLVSSTSLNLYERGRTNLSDRTRQVIVQALEKEGVVFIEDDEEELGVHLRASVVEASRRS